ATSIRPLVDLFSDGDPHAGRNLLRAQEIFMRSVLEILALKRNQALIAARVRALVDRHREVAMTEEVAGRVPSRRDGGRDPFLVEAGTRAHVPRRAEIDHQPPPPPPRL